ncbi:threonine aldolase family protein [Cohnella sp. GCM10027633]|uniref:threonine aldolase family protein n=1 Tax=unclassified Cohnella TaxID=2636738 RepID=UPI00362CFF55
MNNPVTLLDAFKNTEFRISGHGGRNMQVLKDAFERADGNAVSDMYGKGKVIEDFQAKLARYLGKPSAVFFPSGTMAQQIALRIWCDELGRGKVAYHPLSHLELHEEGGLKELHRIQTVWLGDKNRTFRLDDVRRLGDDVACLLIELPQREIGGQLPAYEELEAICAHCREKGIKLHLDGARLFEILPYYGKTASEICALFDSVYVSFYKGLGGIAGAMLAGDESFAARSKVWKRRHGGDVISLYPYIVSADCAFDLRLPRMAQYYRDAVGLAELFNARDTLVTVPEVPVSNMFHVHATLPKERFEDALRETYAETGIGLTGWVAAGSESACYFEISVGDLYREVPRGKLEQALIALDGKLKRMQSRE